ncbi:MAG TPA: ABC transporter ATP-binding protein [Woeseiaceae bacterium]|nr:ABC transporter ATP-binding protein [Woeseiaceae bacterium]
MGEFAVELAGVTRRFREGEREHVVLDALDFEVRAGETVALRGRSGSGKSTLLNLIAGIDTPDAGRVIVAGRELTRLSERERTLFRRAHVGFVYQGFNLVPTLSVADNVRLVLELNDVAKAAADARTQELLEAVGLGDRAASYPDVLSGGEQQRVAIARALAHEPAIVLADEPTGNLDDENARRVLGLLERLVRGAGGTMLIATHSASVARYCDRSVELHHGRLGAAAVPDAAP